LRALFEAHRRGTVDPADAAALVPQMVQLAKAVRFGRGGSAQGWRTVLPGPVLQAGLRAALGAPMAIHPAPGGVIADFGIGGGSGAGAAVASSIVGLAMLATVGAGWVTTSHGQRLATLRVHTTDLPDGAAFQLYGSSGGPWMSLSLHWWRTVDAINQSLLRMEARYLLARALFGPGQPPEGLLTMPRDVLEPRVTQLVGPTDLSEFYPK
jgi:hypothetical protein